MLEFITGAEVIARASVDAGCNFFAGYPITPASGILAQMMRLLPKAGGIAIQGEDEISSIGFCIGASAAGRKVMTATSGPGISLYSENIGLAQMAELPLVIVDVQRMGPATGGATTSAEGDVNFVRWVTSGGYPIIALCPTNLSETYSLTMEAFNLAERFRSPVFLLTCKELVMNRDTVKVEDYRRPELIERRLGDKNFLPYGYVQLSDVPPFLPVGGEAFSRVNTSTHDERGLHAKDPATMDRALRHLSEKIESRRQELEYIKEDTEDGADTIIIAYGLAARSAREAVRKIRRAGKKVSMLTIYSLWPVPEPAIKKAAGACKYVVVPEHNLGQYVTEIRRLLPGKEVRLVTRIDGKMIAPADITRIGNADQTRIPY